jgi:hypothetical protein
VSDLSEAARRIRDDHRQGYEPSIGAMGQLFRALDAFDAAPATPAADDLPAAQSVLRELEHLTPLYNATGPGVDLAKTFSGWEVPDWLMQRLRAALRDETTIVGLAARLSAAETEADHGTR